MCMVSMIYDHYEPKIPVIERHPFDQPFVLPATPKEPTSLDEFRKMLDEFKRDVKAAKETDAKAGEPDCFDPAKAKLEERVRELEKLLAAPPEFVIVSGGTIEPGKYRVIDGKLYKAIDP